jgi:hypothetical protein
MAIYQDESLVKRAHKKVQYTKEQIDELKMCMDPIGGPEFFIKNFMYIQHPKLGRQKLELYPFQVDLIHTYHAYRKSVNMVSRQMGKCVTGETKIKIRNKNTGEVQEITMKEFEDLLNDS